jgi:hypothetical protein
MLEPESMLMEWPLEGHTDTGTGLAAAEMVSAGGEAPAALAGAAGGAAE